METKEFLNLILENASENQSVYILEFVKYKQLGRSSRFAVNEIADKYNITANYLRRCIPIGKINKHYGFKRG